MLYKKSSKFFGQEILSRWVGESEKNLDAVFQEAVTKERSCIFFDEADALMRTSDGREGSSRLTAMIQTFLEGFFITKFLNHGQRLMKY